MPILSDRQRVEFAIPPYLFYSISKVNGAFVPASAELEPASQAIIDALQSDLQAASVEPFTDLPATKQHALLRRVERIGKAIISEWGGQPALSIVMMLWYFLKDLTDREVLILWEGSAMARAMTRLLPMFERGFGQPDQDSEAQAAAGRLLAQLQAEGLYR